MNAPHQNTAQALDIAEQVRAVAGIPCMAVAVSGPEGVMFAAAVGRADVSSSRRASPEDQYPWFSMTKVATATAAMRLHVNGTLDLDTPIGTYLADYTPHPRYGHPTTRNLLTHTAGLRNPMPIRWVRPEGQPEDPALVGRILHRYGTPAAMVGGRASYSNIGYLLVAEVIRAITSLPVEAVVEKEVFRPLGMEATSYRYRPAAARAVGYLRAPRVVGPVLRRVLPDGIVGPRVEGYISFEPFLVNGAGFGGLIGTVSDAARLAGAHAAGGDDPHPVLSQDVIETMRTISFPGKPFDHGIGWFRKPQDAAREPGFVEHYGTGGGYWNAMRVYPGARLAVVAMANTTAKWDVNALFGRLEKLTWR